MTGLIADIGGTNARFALVGPDGAWGDERVLPTADHPSLTAAVRAYLAEAAPKTRIERAAFCIAGPVSGDQVALTNLSWTFSVREVESSLSLKHLAVINDFAAVALSIPRLGEADRARIGGGEPAADAPIAVLGPGTGLGVSALVPGPAGPIALATEGGHVTIAPHDQRESAILDRLRGSFGHVSAERVVSGQGLVNLYQAICGLDGRIVENLSPADITARAGQRRHPACAEALDLFCRFLGTVASDVALTLGARGGVYIAGGIVPKLGDDFAASGFRVRFEDKGRFSDYLRAIPTWTVTHPYPAFLGLVSLVKDAGRTAARGSIRR